MKRLITLLPILTILSLSACEKGYNEKVTVIKDCTGSYLRLDGKDYLICNKEKVDSFADGAVVTAKFKEIKDCTGPAKDAIVCQMYHKHEGRIQVDKIK